MHKIFKNSKEPLFERADRLFNIKPFKIKVLRNILLDYNVKEIATLFDLYVLTGGVPRYIDILTQNKALSLNKALDFILNESSPFIAEIKRNKKKIRTEELKMRAKKLINSFRDYTQHYIALSLEDALDYLE